MKKIVGILLLFIGIFTNTFSQRIVMDMNIPKLEKDVISDIRIYESYGQISDNWQQQFWSGAIRQNKTIEMPFSI